MMEVSGCRPRPAWGDVLRARRARQATRSRLSIEYKGIICEVLGRHLFPTRHHFERINLDRCARGDPGFALWDRPSCDESHEQSANTYSEQSLAHLKSPRWVLGLMAAGHEVAPKMLAGCDGCHKSNEKLGLPMRRLRLEGGGLRLAGGCLPFPSPVAG